MKDLIQHPIRAFAVLCVAAISIYIGWMGYRLNETLSSPGWCSKALQAEKISSQNFGGLTACVDLLTIQLKSLATNSHILFGVMAGCLLVLIVIVIAGGKVSFNVSKTGAAGNIGREDVVPVSVVNPPSQPVPTTPAAPPVPTGPAMPPPETKP